MLIFDNPYGLNLAPWDVAPLAIELDNIFKQFHALNTHPNCVVVMFHGPLEARVVAQAFEDAGFKQAIPFYWVKTNHTVVGPKQALTPSAEQLRIAYMPNRKECTWFVSENPVERPNVFFEQAVTTMLKHPDGTVVNPCEKPPALIKKIIKLHCPVDSNICIIGFGAGGEILGGIEAKVNVYACERDEVQYKATGERLTKLVNNQEQFLLDEIKAANPDTAKPNKRRKTSNKSPNVSPTAPQPVSPPPVPVIGMKCPSCGQPGPGEVNGVCSADSCQTLRYHPNCLIAVEGDLYCGRHAAKFNTMTTDVETPVN